jgi:tRNA-Thr(GGU) m(6)t(6)A37 methyltransferase TsaA
MKIELAPMGYVKSTRATLRDDHWDQEKVSIELDQKFSTESLMGLESFSHVEIIFYMDQVDPLKIETQARHPRNNKEWPQVGIFAQRGKNRPNQIGHTICKILKCEGRVIELQGLDAVDGTPVLDLKPWVKEFGPRGEVRQPAWMSELMTSYW